MKTIEVLLIGLFIMNLLYHFLKENNLQENKSLPLIVVAIVNKVNKPIIFNDVAFLFKLF